MDDKLMLRTDFRDYYDPWFDMDDRRCVSFRHVVFRYANKGIDRIQMYKHLYSYGLTVPISGTPKQLYDKLCYRADDDERNILDTEVVGFTDIVSHRGEGKVKMTLREAFKSERIVFCSVFHPHNDPDFSGGITIRRLFVGDLEFVLEYRSSDDWRSNCGDVAITLMAEKSRRTPGLPLLAIDFIPTIHGMIAVDLNSAPQIGGTGIEAVKSGKEIVAALRRYISNEYA